MEQESRRRPLKVGLQLPESEYVVSWSTLMAMGQRAEELGFDSLWVGDHLLYELPDGRVKGVWDAWSLLAGLAAVTSRVELGPLVACTSFHNPAMIAKKASTIDEISGGRLVLGLGAGWNDAEYRAFGYPTDHRVSRFEEAFTIIRTLLRDGFIDFHGKYYSADNCHLLPRGPRPDGPPLMVGSFGERMLRITAPYVQAWNAWYVDFDNDPQQLAPLMAKVDDACREAGRDPASVERTCAVMVEMTGSVGRPSSSSDKVVPGMRGSAAEVADWLRAYAAAGISHVQVVLDPNTLEAIEEFAPVLTELDRGA